MKRDQSTKFRFFLTMLIALILSLAIFSKDAEAAGLKINKADFNAAKGELTYEALGGKYICLFLHKVGTESTASINSDNNNPNSGVFRMFDFRRDAIINNTTEINGTYKWVICLQKDTNVNVGGTDFDSLITSLQALKNEGEVVFEQGSFTYSSVQKLPSPTNIRVITKHSSGNSFLTFDKVDNASEYYVFRKNSNGSVAQIYSIGSLNEMLLQERGEYCVTAVSKDLTYYLDSVSDTIIFDGSDGATVISNGNSKANSSDSSKKKDDSKSSSSSESSKQIGSFTPINMTDEEKAGWNLVSREPTTFDFQNTLTSDVAAIRGYNSYQGPMCRAAFQMAAPGYNIGNTFQIDYSQRNNESSTGILTTPMSITISIPKNLQKPDRKYAIVCVTRNGESVMLPTSMTGTDKLTFSTMYLNAFGLMYQD